MEPDALRPPAGSESGLQFPADLMSTGKYMTMRITAYQRRSIAEAPITRPDGDGTAIRLPLPRELTDTLGADYNTTASLGPVIGAILEGAVQNNSTRRLTSTGANMFQGNAFDTAGAALVGAGLVGGATVGRTMAAGLAGRLGASDAFNSIIPPGATTAALSQYFGVSVNPFMSVVYNAPRFKTHQFTWRLIPTSVQESNTLRNIIRKLQAAMSPGVNSMVTNNVLFNYPSMLEIFLTPNEYMYQFKRCVIESLSINYAPSSSPAFYVGSNAPVAVDVTMRLQEIEYWTKADYDGSQRGVINRDNIGVNSSLMPAIPASER